uniref:Uncharacterized protein n=1 Tax=Tanacetum cinerariifolium TaxID=118510 RepID=A0A699PYT5_TANCI|nr:hypothetical protein [Tanacetum cinerariifolium]
MNCVSQKKNVIQYPHFTKLIIGDLMKKFPSIPLRIEEDYHSIKDDIPLVSVYTTGNVTVREMMISDAFLTKEICVTDDYKEYETVFINVFVPMNQPPLGEEEQAKCWRDKFTKKITQSYYQTKESKHNLQEKLAEEMIEKMLEGKEDDESYASEFTDSTFNDDVDDFGTRIELGSHKENLKVVVDDDVNDKQKQDKSKDDNVKKIDDAIEEKDNEDQLIIHWSELIQ